MVYDSRLLSGLTVFMTVVEAGSMTRAAEALGLTQAGVGRAIQRLGVCVGVRLLDRTTHTLRLTDEGRQFWERVEPLLDAIEEACGRCCRGRPTGPRTSTRPRRPLLLAPRAHYCTMHGQFRLSLNGRQSSRRARHPSGGLRL